MDGQYVKRTKRTRRRPESGNAHRFTQNDTKMYQIGKHGFWYKKFTSIHDRIALEMNKCLQKSHVPEWMTNGWTTFIQKGPKQKEPPQTITDL